MSSRDVIVLRAAAVWTLLIWGTRMRNILGDDTRSAGFKLVHLALALVSVGFALAIWRVASKNRRAPDRSPGRRG